MFWFSGPITFLDALAATGYTAVALLALFWIFIEIAELVEKSSRKREHLFALITLLGVFSATILLGYAAVTKNITQTQLYLIRFFMIFIALSGWVFTLSFLANRVRNGEGGMEAITGRPEPLMNTAIIIAFSLGLVIVIVSIWSPITPEVERIITKLLVVSSPLFVIYARRWVTPVSDPRGNDEESPASGRKDLPKG